MVSGETGDSSWTYLTNHSHVLICIAEGPDARRRDIADRALRHSVEQHRTVRAISVRDLARLVGYLVGA